MCFFGARIGQRLVITKPQKLEKLFEKTCFFAQYAKRTVIRTFPRGFDAPARVFCEKDHEYARPREKYKNMLKQRSPQNWLGPHESVTGDRVFASIRAGKMAVTPVFFMRNSGVANFGQKLDAPKG